MSVLLIRSRAIRCNKVNKQLPTSYAETMTLHCSSANNIGNHLLSVAGTGGTSDGSSVISASAVTAVIETVMLAVGAAVVVVMMVEAVVVMMMVTMVAAVLVVVMMVDVAAVMMMATVVALAARAAAATAAASVALGSDFGADGGGAITVVLDARCLFGDRHGVRDDDEAEPQRDDLHHDGREKCDT